MKVLVTGANGFLGKFVSKKLIKDGHSVIATDIQNHFLDYEKSETATYTYYCIDLTQSFDQIIPLIAEVDVVVHLAAIVGIQNQIAPALRMFDVNIVAAGNIVRFCSEFDKYLIFASTSEIFGKNPESPWNENSECEFGSTSENRWAYGMGKALIEELIFGLAESEGLRATCIRFFNLYGPGQGYMYLIPKWIKAAMQESPIEIYGSGSQQFSFTYIEDAAEFIVALVTSTITGPINFGSIENISILHLSEVFKDFFPNLIVLPGLPNREGEFSEYSRIPSSIRSDHPYFSVPLTPLKDGLCQTVAFYKKSH
jgi:UDP-glucose 4-epimerase